MTTWVLQNDGREGRMTVNMDIIKRLEETGHQHHVIKIIPFVHEIDGPVPDVVGPVVAYGTTAIDHIVAKHGWNPGVWRTDGVSESRVMEALGDLYLNHDAVVCPVHEAADIAERLGYEFFFTKPDTDNKEFAGMVTDPNRFRGLAEQFVRVEWVEEGFPVVVTPVRNLGIEWRLPVVQGKVVDYSIYRQWRTVLPSREIYQEVLDFAAECIALHDPAPVYVIDICQHGDKLQVVEYNGFNSAGLYACNVANVVDAVNGYVDKAYGTL